MTIEVATRTIGAIVAPGVMVTACAITLGYLLSRYVSIGERLHALGLERLQLIREIGGTSHAPPLAYVRLRGIDAQIPPLLARHRLLRNSALALNYATMVFFLTMFAIAAAALLNVAWASDLALYIFLAGVLLLAWAIALNTREVRHSEMTVQRDLAWITEVHAGGS